MQAYTRMEWAFIRDTNILLGQSDRGNLSWARFTIYMCAHSHTLSNTLALPTKRTAFTLIGHYNDVLWIFSCHNNYNISFQPSRQKRKKIASNARRAVWNQQAREREMGIGKERRKTNDSSVIGGVIRDQKHSKRVVIPEATNVYMEYIMFSTITPAIMKSHHHQQHHQQHWYRIPCKSDLQAILPVSTYLIE